MSTWDRTRGNGLKLQQGEFTLSVSQNHLTRKTVKDRNKLLGEAVKSPLLEVHRSQIAKTAAA